MEQPSFWFCSPLLHQGIHWPLLINRHLDVSLRHCRNEGILNRGVLVLCSGIFSLACGCHQITINGHRHGECHCRPVPSGVPGDGWKCCRPAGPANQTLKWLGNVGFTTCDQESSLPTVTVEFSSQARYDMIGHTHCVQGS